TTDDRRKRIVHRPSPIVKWRNERLIHRTSHVPSGQPQPPAPCDLQPVAQSMKAHKPMQITIRPANQSDAAALARLIEEFNSDYRTITVTPEQAASRLAACAGVETTMLAEIEGQVAGFACLRLVPFMSGDEPYAELSDLFVAAPYRRRGVGRALIERVEQMAHASGAR